MVVKLSVKKLTVNVVKRMSSRVMIQGFQSREGRELEIIKGNSYLNVKGEGDYN